MNLQVRCSLLISGEMHPCLYAYAFQEVLCQYQEDINTKMSKYCVKESYKK